MQSFLLIFLDFSFLFWRHHVGIIEELGKEHKVTGIDEEAESILFITHRAAITLKKNLKEMSGKRNFLPLFLY